jgi:hypothetical protein
VKKRIPAVAVILAAVAVGAGAEPSRWWPVQKAPTGVVTTSIAQFEKVVSPSGRSAPNLFFGPSHMLAQSLSGLCAKAVNEGRLDEMVWIDFPHPDYRRWFEATAKRLTLERRGRFTAWQLLERYKAKGIVKGYVLYSHAIGDSGDESANVATVAAGVLEAAMISEGLEAKAKALGLKRLLDARGKTEAWCFERFRDRLNRSCALLQDPKRPHHRALAVAHRMMVMYGRDEPAGAVYAWLRPLSPIFGWNKGDEGKSVSQLTRWGHVMIGSDWCMNLPLLSAGSGAWRPARKFARVDPRRIRWDDKRHAVAFALSDGDNVQWLMGNYCSHKSYWANANRGRFPFGWGLCLADLAQACPPVLEHLRAGQPTGASMILHGGGYYYADLLGVDRAGADRRELLARHARRIGHYMGLTGSGVLMLFCMDIDSPAAVEAYGIFAKEIPGLTGMLAIQYAPYEGGGGRVFWATSRRGAAIPIVTCKYSMWANLNTPGSGDSAKIAQMVNASAAAADKAGEAFHGWVVVHAWSAFKPPAGDAKAAERGLTPVRWCVDRIGDRVEVVSPEELLWRIRMGHDPKQTRAAIEAWR